MSRASPFAPAKSMLLSELNQLDDKAAWFAR
jgi:hypothetical protein